MRQAFIATLHELAAVDPRVVLLTADLGFMVMEAFARDYPDRFYNVGVAEANMVSMGAGLAAEGYIPFLYSIATFASMRAYEQFRDGALLHGLPVRLVGVGGGFEYGNSGITHYALEDLSIMRAQPNTYTLVPADPKQTATIIKETYALPTPIYYRISKNDKLSVPQIDGRFRLGRVETIGDGEDVLFVTCGAITTEVLQAADVLAQQGHRCTVAVVSSLRPEPTDDLIALLKNFPLAVTVENHYITGGLGSLVAEIIAENGIACRLKRCGVREMPIGVSGSEAYMNHAHGLSCDALVQTTLGLLQVER